jgi:hypothetical protein
MFSLENSPYHTKATRAGYTKGLVIPYRGDDPPPHRAFVHVRFRCVVPLHAARAELRTVLYAADRATIPLSISAQLYRVSHDTRVGKVKARESGDRQEDGLCARHAAFCSATQRRLPPGLCLSRPAISLVQPPVCTLSPEGVIAALASPDCALCGVLDHERRFGLQSGFWIQYDTEPTGTVDGIKRTEARDSTSSAARVVASARATGWDRDPTRLQMTVRGVPSGPSVCVRGRERRLPTGVLLCSLRLAHVARHSGLTSAGIIAVLLHGERLSTTKRRFF